MSTIQINHLEHTFPAAKRSGQPRRVLQGLNFSVEPGEIFGLLGPNGGGKTTLFRILSTILTPSAGQASIMGLDVVKNAKEVREKIGVVFQNPSLDKKLTLFENLLHQGRLYGLSGGELQSRSRDLLNRLSIEDRADDFVEQLSGGLQRRGEIAKGLLHKPSVLLMDEPSTGLDPGARRDMWSYLKELKKEGVTILLTTHLMEEGEQCDRLAILHEGVCVALGTPTSLKSKIGGDVISIQTNNSAQLCQMIKNEFNIDPKILNGTVRIERKEGHTFVPQLVEAFPGFIEAVTIGKPTLEDVFVHETGAHLDREEPA